MGEDIARYLTYHLKLEHATRLADVARFFMYDTIKKFPSSFGYEKLSRLKG